MVRLQCHRLLDLSAGRSDPSQTWGHLHVGKWSSYGSGTSTNYLTVSAYGSGASPIINGNDNTSFIGINLYNNSYVEIEDIDSRKCRNRHTDQ